MKIKFSEKRFALIICFILLFPALAFASDKGIVRTQGIVMVLDLKKNMMIVNEKSFVWDKNTIFNDEKGSPTTFDKLKTKAWVYIEGVDDTVKKRVLVKKIYLLPKYIDDKEKHRYPFLQY